MKDFMAMQLSRSFSYFVGFCLFIIGLPSYAAPLLTLPIPQNSIITQKKMTLRDAILLALRNNPDIEKAQLQRVEDRFAYEVARYALEPQYSLSGGVTVQPGSKPGYNVQPGVSLTNKWGTQFNVGYNTDLQGEGGSDLTITQPLLKGLGQAGLQWLDALDQRELARITYKDSITQAVQKVITDYRALVQAYNSYQSQLRALTQAEIQFKQNQVRYKAGKSSHSDLIQEESNLATTKLSTLQSKSSIDTAYEALLQDLGLGASVKINIDKEIVIPHYRLPTLQQALRIAYKNNTTYLTDLMTIRTAKRALKEARNARLWQVDLVGTQSIGSAGITGSPTGINAQGTPISTGAPFSASNRSLQLNVTVPIHDLSGKQAVVEAQIGLQNDYVQLAQDKRSMISQIKIALNNLSYQRQAIVLAQQSNDLQRKNLKVKQLSRRYGQTSVFEINTLRTTLLNAEQSLIGDKIQYLNSITELYATLGITLKKWNIKLRY